MASENACRVLEIYSHFNSEPGQVLLACNFGTVCARRDWQMTDLQEGLEEANRLGWIEAATRGWRLTESGYREASKRT
jgi:hypothetical protein